MKVKVCGITSLEQMEALQDIGADYVGIIFYEGSKRFGGEILSGSTNEIRALEMNKVGVFVNAPIETIQKAIADYGLSAVQLHGNESPEVCAALLTKVTVIKAFAMADDTDIDVVVASYKQACSYYLFDTATTGYGGSGRKFEWNRISKATIGKPFFLSGGIAPEDIENVRDLKHPYLYAIDINSRFENSPGIKDLDSVETFIAQLKAQFDS
ncbi:MAG: hypothetical protein JWP69_837 [Flaviaesturariibacter sp.]|nr:hypothetical protein [Flaviaesturariibacter sp.]